MEKRIKQIKPITPDKVYQEIPDWVIEGANNCIKEHWLALKRESHFTQNELIDAIQKVYDKVSGTDDYSYKKWRGMLFDKHYLDIEPIYEEAGWEVEYDKPAYCETYDANFTFRRKK